MMEGLQSHVAPNFHSDKHHGRTCWSLAHPPMMKLVEWGRKREPFPHILCGTWHFDKKRCAAHPHTPNERRVQGTDPSGQLLEFHFLSEGPPCSLYLGALCCTGFWEAANLPGETDKQRPGLKQPCPLASTLVTPGNFLGQKAIQFAKS